ncbi:MAG: hypothetical protein AAF170_09170 [Bacteroidota bacterium]
MRQLDPCLRQLVVGLGAGMVLGLATVTSAQPADTLDWKRYYPLEVGNVWEYHGAEAQDQITRYTLVADTIADGRTYYRRQLDFAFIHYPQTGVDTARSTSIDYVRYAEGGVVAMQSVEADTVAFNPCSEDGFERDLRPAFGAIGRCASPPSSFTGDDSVRVEGVYNTQWTPRAARSGQAGPFAPVDVAAIKTYTVHGAIFSTFVADIGPISTGNLWGPRLHYARIGGVSYGGPSVLVRTASTPRQFGAISVRVLQNPVRDLARFATRFPPAQPARWTITDVIGRIVLSADLDPASSRISIPTDGLATGVYRFAVSAAGSQAVAPFTVIR